MAAHIHLPKPIHGWKAFVGEIAVIVIGVLIALSAEELITEYNWERRLERTEQALEAEAADSSFILIEQLVTAPCVVAQIDQVREHLLDPAKAALPLPRLDTPIGPMVIRAPTRAFTFGAWQAAISDGTVPHMDGEQQADTAEVYAQQESLDALMGETDNLRWRLIVLADPIELTDGNRFAVLQTLAELRMKTTAQQLIAAQLLEAIRDAGRLPAERKLAEMAEAIEQSGGTVDLCRDRGWPVGDWREQLAAQAQLPDD
jgi:hypothetical protein